jgi:hypothetical protein
MLKPMVQGWDKFVKVKGIKGLTALSLIYYVNGRNTE